MRAPSGEAGSSCSHLIRKGTSLKWRTLASIIAATFSLGGLAAIGATSSPAGASGTAITAPLPSNATVNFNDGQNPDGLVNDISCPAVNACVAVGDYNASNGSSGFVDIETASGWTSQQAPVPSDSSGGSPSGGVNGVSCWAANSCAIVGFYSEGAEGCPDAYLAVLNNGTWTSTDGSAPTDGNSSGPCGALTASPSLFGVSCPGAGPSPGTGSCVAVGQYILGSDERQGLVETLSSGTWTPAEVGTPTPPYGGVSPSQTLHGVSCTAIGSCVAAGTYANASDQDQPWLATLAAGNWTSQTASSPSDANTSDVVAELNRVSCTGTTTIFCMAVGEYYNNASHYQGLIETSTAGSSWTPATAPLPSNGNPASTVDMEGVSCVGTNTCATVAGFPDISSNTDGLYDFYDNGTWTSTAAALPSDAITGPSFEQLWAVGCIDVSDAADCLAGGRYFQKVGTEGSSVQEGVLVTENQPPPSIATYGDLTGAGLADSTVYRPSNGTWYINANGTTSSVQWGTSTDIPVPGDYLGGTSDQAAVYRPSNGTWYVDNGPTVQWGTSTDIPVPGDYLGNGMDQEAVYRPSNGTWYVYGGATTQFGAPGDIPVPGDYQGNGTTDMAVYRPSNGTWYIDEGGTTVPVSWGTSGDIPVPGDYQGNGMDQEAVYRPSNGTWYINGGATIQWGTSTDIPVPADYLASGTTNEAVYRPSNGTFYVNDGPTTQWGASTDIPVLERTLTGDVTNP